MNDGASLETKLLLEEVDEDISWWDDRNRGNLSTHASSVSKHAGNPAKYV